MHNCKSESHFHYLNAMYDSSYVIAVQISFISWTWKTITARPVGNAVGRLRKRMSDVFYVTPQQNETGGKIQKCCSVSCQL